MNKVLIAIPTYNEVNTVMQTIRRIRELCSYDLLVIDDNSPDGTAKLVLKESREISGLHLLVNPRKGGLADAYLRGFEFAIENGFDFIIQMDADGSHDAMNIQDLVNKINEGYNLVIASRYISGGSTSGWNTHRLLLSKLANIYSRWILRLPVKDLTSGYRIYRITALQNLMPLRLRSKGFAFQIEMTTLFHTNLITELPTKFVNRQSGASKLNLVIIMEALFLVWALRGERKG